METIFSPYQIKASDKTSACGLPQGITTMKEFVAPDGYIVKVQRVVFENFRGNWNLNVEYRTCGVSFKSLKKAVAYAEKAIAEWI